MTDESFLRPFRVEHEESVDDLVLERFERSASVDGVAYGDTSMSDQW